MSNNFITIYRLFRQAARSLKYPKIKLEYLRLYRAGPTAKFPGTINVIGLSDNEWLGRIHSTGRFETSRYRRGLTIAEYHELTKFNENPAGYSATLGRRTGTCVFCQRLLTDRREGYSIDVGYGPICADKYDLPWGDKLAVTNTLLDNLGSFE